MKIVTFYNCKNYQFITFLSRTSYMCYISVKRLYLLLLSYMCYISVKRLYLLLLLIVVASVEF